MKINLGSNKKMIGGYVNVDGLQLPGVDVVHDLTQVPYPFEDGVAEEIVMIEVLEHLSFRSTLACLKECYRILKDDGVLIVQVPDIGAMCGMYVAGEICDCVPRKASSMEEYKGNPLCPYCDGKGKIHTERWRFAFAGAQKHKFDAHLNHFTAELLERDLMQAGFYPVTFENNLYKLIAKARKTENV